MDGGGVLSEVVMLFEVEDLGVFPTTCDGLGPSYIRHVFCLVPFHYRYP